MARKITFEDLARDPFHAQLIKAAEQTVGTPLPNEVKEWMVNQASWADIIPKQIVEWVKDLKRVSDSILAGTECPSDYGIFWVRLYGLLTEIRKYFGPGTLVIEEKSGRIINELIERILAKFSQEEFLWIEHERMCHCHVNQQYNRKSLIKGKDGKYTLAIPFNSSDVFPPRERIARRKAPSDGS
jgi:hypothetical protein